MKSRENEVRAAPKSDRPRPGSKDSAAGALPLSKMTSGSEELRDHDFPPVPPGMQSFDEPVAIDTGAPPMEQVQSGGKPGTVPGDKQRKGDVPTIMDQDLVQPDFAQEH